MRIDDTSYKIRFTPRKPRSIWSDVNVRRAKALIEAGLMSPAGLAAFEARSPDRSGVYSFEQRKQIALDPAYEKRFRANAKAWEVFQSRPPWYRRTAIFWVMTAKQESTRERRLSTLIEDSAAGRPIGPVTRK